jgi:hypothetical protein
MKNSLLALALLCVPTSLFAQVDNIDPQYRAVCREASIRPFTPPPADPAIKPDCDSSAAYYGIGHPVDYTAARSCALTEYANPVANPSIFYGPGILSMIYANGQGVPADLDLATRFTCESVWSSPAEIETRLDLLAEARINHTPATLDLCDTATSANSDGWCTSLEARFSDIDRKQKLDQLRSTLAATSITSFEALQKAQQDFEDARTTNEIAVYGSAQSSAFYEQRNDLRDQFYDDLVRITASTFQEPTPIKKADSTLADAYKPIRIGASKAHLPLAPKTIAKTRVTFKGVEETQAIWLQLRDAWTTFALAANPIPNVDTQAAAVITLQRADQLKQLTQSVKD